MSLPAATHVGAVHLQVADLTRSIDYYERVLGLRTLERHEQRAALGPHDDDRVLLRLQTRPGVVPARRGAFGLYHFAILLPDDRALGRFAAHLAALRVRVGSADHLVSQAFYLWDPDGLGIEVYADRPRDTWQRRGGELVMATDPLDIAAVIAEADGPWTGMPPRTTMGHVHLHVGDLERADAFYHRGIGLDRVVWSYPGALFLSAGGYHHHLGTNTWSSGPAAEDHEARMVQWELIVPGAAAVETIARDLAAQQAIIERAGDDLLAADPWGTRVHVLSAAR